MKIIEILSVPRFLTAYDREADIFDFSQVIIGKDITIDKIDKNILYKIETDDVDKEFINFYLEKSYLNKVTGECKYEDETNVPQSIMYEIFKVKFDNEEKDDIKIKSYDGKELVLISI